MIKDAFFFSLTPLAVLFTCIAIGFILKKLKLLPDNASTVLSKLETFVFCPALTISTFATRFTVENLKLQYNLLL